MVRTTTGRVYFSCLATAGHLPPTTREDGMKPISLNPQGFRPFVLNIRCPTTALTSLSLLWIMRHFESEFGKISYFKFPKDPHTEWYRGFGFIHFADKSAGMTCLEAGPIHEVSVPTLPLHSLKHGHLRLSDFINPQSRTQYEIIKCFVEQGRQSNQNGIEQRPTIDTINLRAHQSINHEELKKQLQDFGGFFDGLLYKKRSKGFENPN
ncbi:hypothetical protein CROQUDRAFT_272799 [Cronartium quercuum f. sp. fusiforme G11]|uniref:RRM domain-containing protein n=1 Tax=Cronartium quercuum f. sp. fusiforme G11 TaxID=708437 RepID=A0A9P6NCD6_9BASI|nr:hypothetical protein CROQUDRAFT_272799 [Cronartium quercuum f. sp. fusiforme G11]